MKGILFLAISLIAITSIGQMNTALDSKVESRRSTNQISAQTSANRATPFWSEDFAGGFPSDWVNIDSSGICPWRYSTDGS
jgi:hypothetical protein